LIRREKKSRLPSSKSEENECLKKKITEMETVIKELNEKLVQLEKNLLNKNEEFESFKIETKTKYKNMHNNNTELLNIAKEEKEKYKLSIEENEMLKRNNSEMETIVKELNEKLNQLEIESQNKVIDFENFKNKIELLKIIKQEREKSKFSISLTEENEFFNKEMVRMERMLKIKEYFTVVAKI
jgi:hypothetical protein